MLWDLNTVVGVSENKSAIQRIADPITVEEAIAKQCFACDEEADFCTRFTE